MTPSRCANVFLVFVLVWAGVGSWRPPVINPPIVLPEHQVQREQLLAHYQELLHGGKVFANTSAKGWGNKDGEWVCMVGVMKTEESFLDEWLAYHRLLGFDYFFFCDNGNLDLAAFLKPHIYAGYVAVIPWPDQHPNQTGANNQFKCYDLAAYVMDQGSDERLKKCGWVAYLDCDEFVAFSQGQAKGGMGPWLATFDGKVGSISIPEMRFGHNDYYDDPPDNAFVTTSFTRRESGKHKVRGSRTKTISRVRGLRPPMKTPHTMEVREGFRRARAGNTVRMHHYRIRSFLRWMARNVRGDVIDGPRLTAEKLQYQLWRFVRAAQALNEVEDTLLAGFRDDVIAHLDELGIWHNRSERLLPYALNVQLSVPLATGLPYDESMLIFKRPPTNVPK